MTQVVWAPQAIQDVEAIRTMSRETPRTMLTLSLSGWLPRWHACRTTLGLGAWYLSFGDESIREVIHGNYRIVYRLRHDVVEIATVFHGARSFRLD